MAAWPLGRRYYSAVCQSNGTPMDLWTADCRATKREMKWDMSYSHYINIRGEVRSFTPPAVMMIQNERMYIFAIFMWKLVEINNLSGIVNVKMKPTTYTIIIVLSADKSWKFYVMPHHQNQFHSIDNVVNAILLRNAKRRGDSCMCRLPLKHQSWNRY